jgi:hypothetical protein
MAWTTPVTWATNQLVTAADLNTQVRDNLGYLLNGRPYSNPLSTGQYGTTSTTYVDVDATAFTSTLTINSGRALVFFACYLYNQNVAGTGQLTLLVDGVDQGGANGLFHLGQNGSRPVVYMKVISGLSAASHIFKLQWKVSVGTQTISIGQYGSANPVWTNVFAVQEV